MFSREANERARTQFAYGDLQGRLARERTAYEAHAKDAATQRAVERALVAILADGLRAYPDVFAGTKLSPTTVDEYAALFASQI